MKLRLETTDVFKSKLGTTSARFIVKEEDLLNALVSVFEKVLSLDSSAMLSIHRSFERGHLGGFDKSYNDIAEIKADWPEIFATLGDYELEATCSFTRNNDMVSVTYSIVAKDLHLVSATCDCENFADWQS